MAPGEGGTFGLPVMQIRVHANLSELAAAAATDAAGRLRSALRQRGHARIVAATGASQIAFLDRLVREPDLDWSAVELFHLDEYIGLSAEHPASFRRYLLERLIGPAGITRYHLLDGQSDPSLVCADVGARLQAQPVDVALVGIGENAHLAFNDPPADFETTAPYILVDLDQRCRQQQVGEGWFATLDEVPASAISMSVHQILQANAIVCIVPDLRKAEAVQASLEGPIGPETPASILRTHRDVTFHLDRESASLLAKA
jgi:glucosamine-6-phosphate deaminase